MSTGAALLALIAMPPLLAQGKGNDKDAGGPPSAVEKERGNAAGRRGGGPPDTRKGAGGRPDKVRGPSGWPEGRGGGAGNRGRGSGSEARARGNADKLRGGPRDRAPGNAGRADRGPGNAARGGPRGPRGESSRIDRTRDFALRDLRDTFGIRPRLISGCPPGLAKKRNGCLPPGQARQRYRRYDPGFFGLFGAERGRYFYEDGYLLRYRDDGLAGFLPLLGGALGIGNVWPDFYEPRPLPSYYSEYFRLGEPRGYRYADNVIYRVEPETAAITSVAALLTGSDIEVGRPMPRGYDVYNVPYAYRDRYQDTPQARYRYADGYIYEIDPETALVASAIELAL